MGLHERWAGEPNKISVHHFAAAMREWKRGNINRAAVVNAFSLNAAEQTELDAIKAKYDLAVPTDEFTVLLEDVMILSETGDYDRDTAKARLGFT